MLLRMPNATLRQRRASCGTSVSLIPPPRAAFAMKPPLLWRMRRVSHMGSRMRRRKNIFLLSVALRLGTRTHASFRRATRVLAARQMHSFQMLSIRVLRSKLRYRATSFARSLRVPCQRPSYSCQPSTVGSVPVSSVHVNVTWRTWDEIIKGDRPASSRISSFATTSPRFVLPPSLLPSFLPPYPNHTMKLPKIKFPTLITTREDGRKEFIGLTGKELVVSTGVLCGMYAVLAGFFTALLLIAQTIRNGADTVRFPTTRCCRLTFCVLRFRRFCVLTFRYFCHFLLFSRRTVHHSRLRHAPRRHGRVIAPCSCCETCHSVVCVRFFASTPVSSWAFCPPFRFSILYAPPSAALSCRLVRLDVFCKVKPFTERVILIGSIRCTFRPKDTTHLIKVSLAYDPRLS